MANSPDSTVLDEIKATENAIKTCYTKVAELQEKIKHPDLSEECRKIADQELDEVKKLLAKSQMEISQINFKDDSAYYLYPIFLGVLLLALYSMCFMKMDIDDADVHWSPILD